MTGVDVVLYNSLGCEIAREVVENENDYEDAISNIISGWMLQVGDRIEIVETWREE